jgi:hypothetical protein
VENTVQEDTGETIVGDEIIEAEVAESIAEPAPVVVAEIVPEPVTEPVFLEKPVFLEQWIRKVSGYEPEIIGGFEFFANSQGWHFDTPSEWKSKLSRWVNPAS